MNDYALDWADLAFGSKKPLTALKATFIMAPRQMSTARFTQLIKTYLAHGNIVVGVAHEAYVEGFEGQPQFEMLKLAAIQQIIDKVGRSSSPYKIYSLSYNQRDTIHVLEKSQFKRVILVNGSWKYTFHTLDRYYLLNKLGIPFEFVSPFTDEVEAVHYAQTTAKKLNKIYPLPKTGSKLSAEEMFTAARIASYHSYDNSYQTGVALGLQSGQKYELLTTAHNKIVPYETFGMLHGAARERHLSPPHDLNHYDTVHAEVNLLLTAQKQGISLQNTSFFINLLPCPTCARMLCESDIKELVYQTDHSEGYAVYMLEQAGKKVRRLVDDSSL